MKKKVVIIGSGPGGAAAGALLSQRGHEVTLLEEKPFEGGRCTSLNRDGFIYDFGVHMFSRGDSGPHGEVNRLTQGNLQWITKNPAARVIGKVAFDFPLDIRGLFSQIKLARNLGVGIKNYLEAFRLIKALMKGEDVAVNDGITAQAFVNRYTDDEMIHLFINCVCQLYFALSYKEASAGEFIWCFKRMFNEAAFGYPRGASKSIPHSFLESFKRNQGKLHLHAAVTRIKIENGKVKGVETEGGYYPAGIVISSAGIQPTIMLSGKENFPESYLAKVNNMTWSNAYITIKYALGRKIIPYPVVFHMPDLPAHEVFKYIEEKTVPDDFFIFMPVPSNQDPELAPSGCQLVIAGTVAPPFASEKLCQAILDKLHIKVCDLFPGLEEAIIWHAYSTRKDTSKLIGHPAGECIGLAQTPDQVGIHRLSSETPVEGLYLVGADAGARGIGTELASGSALNLVQRGDI